MGFVIMFMYVLSLTPLPWAAWELYASDRRRKPPLP